MSWDSWATETKEPQDPTWGDYGQTIKSGAGSAVAGTAGVLRWAFDNGKNSSGELWKAVEDIGNKYATESTEGMTETGRKRFEAGITSPEFWEHPVSSMMLKATGQVPNLIAMGLPGGVINDARLAIAASTAIGGTLSAGDLVDGVIEKTDKLSEEELQKIPLYRGLRADMGEREARTEYNNQILGWKVPIAFALGAASDFAGPVVNVIRGAKGGARHGVMRAAAEGFTGEAADEGGGAYLGQTAEIQGGLRKEYDIPAIIDQALTGGALGGVMSGASGIGGGKGKAKADEIRAKRAGEEDVEVQPPSLKDQVAAGQEGVPAATAKPKVEKNQVVAVDPAIKEALDEKTQPAPAPQQPVEPPVPPTPPPQAAAPQAAPNVPQTPPPSAVQPQQQQVAEQPPAAAAASPVTPEVTSPDKPVITDRMFRDLYDRGVQPDEAVRLTRQQIAEVMNRPAGAPPTGEVSAPPVAPSTTSGAERATDFSARAREGIDAPNSQAMPSASEQVATAPTATQAEPFGTEAPAVNKGGGRIIRVGPDQAATLAPVDIGPKGEKAIKAGNKSTDAKAAEAVRKDLATQLHAEHTSPEHAASGFKMPDTLPATPAERKALAAQLKPIVDELKTRIELREDVATDMPHVAAYYNKGLKDPIAKKPTEKEVKRWYSSLPGRVGGNDLVTGEPRHLPTQYLRELVDVQKILEGNRELGPKGKNRARVESFFTAFNTKGLDLVHSGRSNAAADIRAARGGTTDSEAGAQETGKATEGVKSTESEGAANKGEVLTGAAKVAAIKEFAERQAKKEANAKAAAEVLARPVETKPRGAEVVTTAREKAAEKVTPEVKPVAEKQQEEAPLPRKEWHITEIRDDMHEGYKPIAIELNRARAWVNALSDADYAKLSRQPLLMLQDANSIDTVHKIGKWFKEDLGRGPFDGDTKIAAKAKAEQDELVKDVIGETKKAPPKEDNRPQDEIDAEKEREAREELARSNERKERPKTTEAASAEDLAAYAPRAPSKPVVTENLADKRRAEIRKALAERGGTVKLKHDLTGMTEDQIMAQMEADLASIPDADIRDMDTAEIMKHLNRREEMVLFPSEHDIWETSIHKTKDIYGHEEGSLSEPMKLPDVLRNLDFSHLSKTPKYVQDFVRRRLSEVLDRVPLYIANNNLIADSLGDPHHQTAGGYYTNDNKAGDPGHIVINETVIHDRQMFTHVVIHEAMHAALSHRLNTDSKFHSSIETLMNELNKKTSKHRLRDSIEYAFENPHEFVSEAMSNPTMQIIMSKMNLDPEVAKALGLQNKPLKSNTLWGAFVEKVRSTLKIPEGGYNFLHETLKVIAPQLQRVESVAMREGSYRAYGKHALSMDALRAALPNADTRVNTAGTLARAKDKISSVWMMARRGAAVYGPSNPLHRLFEERAKQEHSKDLILKKYGGLESAEAIARAEREHPEAMAKAKDVIFDASLHDVNLDGSNDHLGKDKLMGIQAKNEIARLQKAWNDPAINPVRKVLQDAAKSYRDVHNAVSRETINNILAEANIHDPAMAERIHNEGLNDADRATYKDSALVRALDQVKELKRRQGTYVPFRRFGEFVSTANHELSVPANATKINDNTLQFVDPSPKNGTDYGDSRARAAVKGYLRSNSHTPQGNKLTPAQIRKVWVDKTNPSEIIEKEQPNAIPAYRVSMQTQHTEMHATRAEAENNKAALKDAGLVGAATHARDDAYTNARNIQGAMGTILRSLEKQQRYIDADETQKAAMREMFHDLTLGLSGTTSIKNSMRQRRNVAGMSRDLGRVTADYARMTANHLAMLQHRPKIDKIFAEMREYKEAHRDDNNSIRRDEIYKEFVDRIYGRSAQVAEEHKTGVTTRLLQMSRLSRLAGPSFHIINAHEPWTTSLPVIGGRHGFTATLRQLTDSYNFIGGRAGVMAGLKDTARAFTDNTGFTDYVKLFKDTIGKSKILGADKASRMQDVIDYMAARNLYANSAIFEVGKYAAPDSNIAGRALDRADLMANQVGSAIEAINRTVTGLTAYNLEYKKNGGNHEAAMHYAYTTAHETMGDYSSWNAAPIFNSPLGRVALQFKKFGHKTYYLLGNIIGGALKGDPQAMKQFAGLMVTHGLVAGALGLPTEPFKAALVVANAVGLTGFTPDDYDYAVRQLAARVAGQKGGEIISRGLYRGIGIEASGRLGLDSPFTFGAPKSNKDTDLKSFLFDTMAGAPVGFLLDQVKAAQAAFKGDFATAIEKASPLRTVGDITKAVVGATGPKTGDSGKEKQAQFTPWQTFVRAMGFTPSAVAEHGALVGTVARESKQASADRSAMVNAWLAATGPDKVKAQRAVQSFNEDHPKNQQITQSDLSAAARRRESEKAKTKHGVTTTKRNKAIQDQAESVFNP